MRKHVKPALPLAVILDPERGKRLPPQGALVAWSHYWAGLEAREDIIVVSDEAAAEAAEAPAEPDPAESEAHA